MANKKIKTINYAPWLFIFLALGAIILIIWLLLAMFKPNSLSPRPESGVLDLAIMAGPRSFMVLSAASGGSYFAQEIGSAEETVVVVPQSAVVENFSAGVIKAGDIIILQEYIAATNGLVAKKLRVLPALPKVLPNNSVLPVLPHE